MHPNPTYRHVDRALCEALLDQAGFGMVFFATPAGPRVAHTPLVSTGDGTVQFHLSRANELTKYLAGETALMVVNGPEAYVSPRWYDSKDNPPTWNYVALELEGRVQRMNQEGLVEMLYALSAREETKLKDGAPWTSEDVGKERWRKLLSRIVGFELEVNDWRPTVKLSQNRSASERKRIADALEVHGSAALAKQMRKLTA